MSIFGSVGIAAAERLERSAGPRVAMRSYEALLGASDGVAIRATAGFLRCLVELNDDEARDRFAAGWPRVRHDPWPAVVHASKTALRLGFDDDAVLIADTEAQRADRARSWYLLARLHEQRAHHEAMVGALRRATTAPDALESAAARAAAVALLVMDASRPRELPEPQGRRQRLVVEVVRLTSEDPEERRVALARLASLARGDDALAAEARRWAVLHGERQGASLPWREAEPIVDALMTAEAPASERALRRLQARRPLEGQDPEGHALAAACRLATGGARHVDLCRAIVERVDIDPSALDEQGEQPPLVITAMRAVHAMVHRQRRPAREHLVALCEADLAHAPGAVWTAARLALDDPTLADRGSALMRVLVRAKSIPPRDYGSYVGATRRHGDHATADELLRRGMARGETTARDALIASLVQSAWRAFADGDPRATRRALREAKALSGS